MAIEPRKTEIKALMPLLEEEYDSAQEAALAVLTKAYELYEKQARFYVVGQVRPGSGWRSPEEGREGKVVLGPFGTLKQAQNAGESLAYSSSTGEEARWWAVEAWHDTPAAWYAVRSERWKREGYLDGCPREHRLIMQREWLIKNHPSKELPPELRGSGWDGLDEFMTWMEEEE